MPKAESAANLVAAAGEGPTLRVWDSRAAAGPGAAVTLWHGAACAKDVCLLGGGRLVAAATPEGVQVTRLRRWFEDVFGQ